MGRGRAGPGARIKGVLENKGGGCQGSGVPQCMELGEQEKVSFLKSAVSGRFSMGWVVQPWPLCIPALLCGPLCGPPSH